MSKINETKKRSLFKALSHWAAEVGIATAIFHFGGGIEVGLAVGLAAASEATCVGLYYAWERLWNKTDFGRNIVKEK